MSEQKSNYDFDLFVIGAGSGGVRASRIAAGYGARVAVAEDRELGGTCVNVGCVPKKLMVLGSHYAHDFVDSAAFGWTVKVENCNWKTLIENKNKEILRLNGVYQRLLTNAGVKIIEGRAKLVDAHTVAVGDLKYTADKILVCTGSWPFVPQFPGAEHSITSNEAFYLPELPKHITVVGGGYIAVEFACIFKGYGADVTLLYRGEEILRGFDSDIAAFLHKEMVKAGIDVRVKVEVKQADKTTDGLHLSLTDDSTLDTGLLMMATGRVPKTKDLGLEAAGVEMDHHGAIKVNEYSRTNVPNIYAVGDVTNLINLTPVALHEGHCFADTVFGGKDRKPDHQNVASAVFSTPPIGCVGLTEKHACDQFGAENIRIFKSEFRPMKHTLTNRDSRVLMKLVVEKTSDRVVGLHMCGDDAGEIVQGFAVAVKAGATKAQFDATLGIHPTSAEEFVTMRTPVSEVGCAPQK